MPGAMDDALIDKLAARVIDKLSKKIIQEIAWEVVPDLAEGMIKREIDALKAKLAKVPK
jgi:carbon monoxide dehydrogenase subunit G